MEPWRGRAGTPALMSALAVAGVTAIAYFLTAKIGLAMISQPSGVAVFWPASGVAAGVLILLGRQACLSLTIGVVVGTIVANLLSDRNFLTSTLNGFCNAGEAVLFAWLLESWYGRPFVFGDVNRVAGFVTAAGLAAAAAAIGGAATMTLFHTAAPFWDVWRTWFLSDGVGILVVAPLVIGFGQLWCTSLSRWEWTEGVGVIGLVALASSYAMNREVGSWISFSPGAIVLPVLLWLTARCHPTFGIAGAFVASVAIIVATTFGFGRFGDVAVLIAERVKGAQLATTMVTLYTLVLAALFAQRKKAEEELRHSKAELDEAQRVGRIGSWYWSPKTDGIVASEEILRIYGFDPATERAPNFRDQRDQCYPVEDWERLHAAARRTMQTGVGYELELRAFRKGTPIWVLTRGEAVRNSGGLIVGMRGTVQDITQRRAMELALAERTSQLTLAGKAALVGTYAYDVKTEMMQISDGYAVLFGLPEGTAETLRSQWAARVHPDDVEGLESVRSQAFRQQLVEYNADYRIVLPGRGVRWIEARSFISYDSIGHPHRVVGVINIDVTERKQAEQGLADRNKQLELAGEAALVGSFVVNLDGGEDIASQRIRVSPGYATIFGFSADTVEISVKDWRSQVHPADLSRVLAQRHQALAERRRQHLAEYRIIRPSSETRWIESRAFITYDKDGRAQRMVGVAIDVTDRKQVEERQRVLLAELDHRVKNVLATVSAVASRTLQESSSMADFVAVLDGRIRSMAATHQLLSASRWQGVSLTELVQGELAPFAAKNNVETGGPEVVLSPEAGQAMAMVLHELATNAAKYGALSNDHGRVSLHWAGPSNGSSCDQLVLQWRETGGPQVEVPKKSGYGTSVIRDLLPFELDGIVDYVLAPDGVRCTLQIPAKWLRGRTTMLDFKTPAGTEVDPS
jgi:PAS domain S-box-containing protein